MTHLPIRNTMACLVCGYALDGLPSPVCPECGSEFDPADATTFRRILPDPVQLGRFEMTQAYAACMMLERYGVPATVHREEDGIIGHQHIPKGALWVDRSDEQRARSMLETFAHKAEHTSKPWMCAQCGEDIEGQFDSCWSCGEDRPAAEK